ncbi:MAG: RNA methyltransferase, partial [Chitinophagaceae bacterium]
VYTDLNDWLQAQSIKKYAAALNGKAVHEFTSTAEAILVIGNESKGISKVILDMTDEKITIPRLGAAESLNAAVATGIILYEMSR